MRTVKSMWIAPVVALLSLGLATPASAAVTAPSNTPDAGAALINGRLVTDETTAQRLIEGYWTPDRLRAALPVDKPAGIEDPALELRDRPGRMGEPRDEERPVGPQNVASTGGGAMGTQSVNASPGVGKVFFRNAKDGKDYVCSGSTINNPAKNLVSTAGHCVHGGKGGDWHENWVYIPYFDHGAAPYGKWPAKLFTSVKGWTNYSYSWWDFAFVNVWPNNGIKLVHKTGGNALSFNYSKWSTVTLLAYPHGAPFDGQWQHFCHGGMYPKGTQQVGFNCLFTGGASGGPFLRLYDNTIRFGFVSSVIAHGPDDKNFGPYFDDDVLNTYNAAKNIA